MSVYLAMYSTEISVLAALGIGFALGAWLFYEHGKEHGQTEGFAEGCELGRCVGFALAKEQGLKRDAKGRFVGNG